MIVIVCLDDNQGMLFNKRRQSRDSKVLEDVWRMTDKLWISPFSEKLFGDYSEKLIIDEALLQKAGDGAYCFIENQKICPHIDKVEELVVYKWNRKYPSDFKLDVDYDNWLLKSQEEFEGNSHEKITKEVYIRGV